MSVPTMVYLFILLAIVLYIVAACYIARSYKRLGLVMGIFGTLLLVFHLTYNLRGLLS